MVRQETSISIFTIPKEIPMCLLAKGAVHEREEIKSAIKSTEMLLPMPRAYDLQLL